MMESCLAVPSAEYHFQFWYQSSNLASFTTFCYKGETLQDGGYDVEVT